MKILFIHNQTSYIKEFSQILIPTGIEFGMIDSFKEAKVVLFNNYYDLIIMDIDTPSILSNDIPPNHFIDEIKKIQPTNNFVILTSQNDQKYLSNYFYKGIYGFMYKSSNIYDILKQFCFILKSLPLLDRKYVRVKPQPDEVAMIRINMPSKGINLMSYITDISIKGVAFDINGKKMPAFVSEKETIENVKVFLGNRIIDLKGKILKRKDTAFLIFDKISKFSHKLLCKYLADKLVSVDELNHKRSV